MSVPDSVVQLRTARCWYLQARQKRYDELWEMYPTQHTTPIARFAYQQTILAQIDQEEKEDSSDG